VVSIPPQAGIIERVAGGRCTVQVLVQPGQEPHTYEPTPRQVAEVGQADLCFTVGLPFEQRLVVKLRGREGGLRFVDMAAGVHWRMLPPGDGHAHPDDAHDHDHPDPHVWLDPANLEQMAVNASRALAEVDSAGASLYARGLADYRAEIAAADARNRALLEPLAGQRIYVFHPAFGYFTGAYGLEQVAVEFQGKEPTPRRLAELIADARARDVRVVFSQPQFSPQSAQTIADAIGGLVVPMDPLDPDVLGNLERMARTVRDALAPEQDRGGATR
jgi:zinc transport system substrate-binding protein